MVARLCVAMITTGNEFEIKIFRHISTEVPKTKLHLLIRLSGGRELKCSLKYRWSASFILNALGSPPSFSRTSISAISSSAAEKSMS